MQGADAAIQSAAQRGYEAVIMVIVILSMLGFFGILSRWFLKSTDRRLQEAMSREERLGARIDELERFIQDTLLKMVQQVTDAMLGNTKATQTLTDALNARLCILDPSRQEIVIDRLGDRLSERTADLARKERG
jgi:flagellar basal body-associated protein FliL